MQVQQYLMAQTKTVTLYRKFMTVLYTNFYSPRTTQWIFYGTLFGLYPAS